MPPLRGRSARNATRSLAALVAGLGFAAFASACAPLPHLASGPIDVGPAPTAVRFDAAVRAALDDFTLCYEFRLPRESDDARRIVATLVTPSQQRFTFEGAELDRRGEFVVCRIGRVVAASGNAAEKPQTFTSVELTADTPLRLRGLRGGPTAEAS